MLVAFFITDTWSFVTDNWDVLGPAVKVTLECSAIAIVGAFFIGAIGGAARAYRIPVLSQIAAVYVEVIRCTPILVQIFFLYYGLAQPPISIQFDAFTVTWLAVLIWGGAYNIENFRAGFEAVPQRYREAGLALGFTRLKTFLNVSLPVGGRIALPPSINTYIAQVKNTALVYAIGGTEATSVTLNLNAATLQTVECFTFLAVLYLTIVWSLSALIRLLEGHLALPEEAR